MSSSAGDREIAVLAETSASVAQTRAALHGVHGQAWFVGGAVRDLLLGIPVDDVDLAVTADARAVARTLHDQLGGAIFSLSDRFGTWRVLVPGGPQADAFQIDVSPLRGSSIEGDLAQRDFTANAIALRTDDCSLTDPYAGRSDIAERLLRLVHERAYKEDPLRPLRLPRLAATLGFSIDPDTAAATRRHAKNVSSAAAERVFAELRGLIGAAAAPQGLHLLDDLGLLDAVLPELARLKGVEQSDYHHLDAYEHTLEVFERQLEIEAADFEQFCEHAEQLVRLLDRPLADELTRAGALRWAALLHDVAKSETRVEHPDGRVGFPAHDERGAVMALEILRRLNASERLARFVSALTLHHLRLGYLVGRRPLERREIHSYLRATSPVEVEVGVLSVADRLATRGRKSEIAISAHLDLAIEMTGEALAYRLHPQAPLLRGDELATALGIEPGPRLGELLEEIAAAQFAGEIADAKEAIELARNKL